MPEEEEEECRLENAKMGISARSRRGGRRYQVQRLRRNKLEEKVQRRDRMVVQRSIGKM